MSEDEEWQMVTKPQTGNVVVIRNGLIPWHVGLVVTPDRMIHCQEDIGTTIEKFNEIMWRRRIVGFFKYA